MELATKAVERLFDNLEYQNDFEYSSGNDHGYFSGNTEKGWAITRLRADFETLDEAKFSDEQSLEALKLFLMEDVEDLVENGDSQGSQDVLLRNLDGSKKRGVEPLEVDIIGAKLLIEPKPKKESTEITLYFTLAVKWPM